LIIFATGVEGSWVGPPLATPKKANYMLFHRPAATEV
jgi:hypothetical protein